MCCAGGCGLSGCVRLGFCLFFVYGVLFLVFSGLGLLYYAFFLASRFYDASLIFSLLSVCFFLFVYSFISSLVFVLLLGLVYLSLIFLQDG